jgi:transposase-like protein
MAHGDEVAPAVPSTPMTDAEYLNHHGLNCPFCESHEIEAPDGVEIEAGTATQNMGCRDCGREWTDFYKLIGYTAIPE